MPMTRRRNGMYQTPADAALRMLPCGCCPADVALRTLPRGCCPADVAEQAEDMFLRLVEQTAEHEGVTEQPKADNQIAWVGRMDHIRSRAAEILHSNLICNENEKQGANHSLLFSSSNIPMF